MGVPGELFFLRLLLLKFPARSYADLRLVDGVSYATFQEAARAHGLVADDSEYLLAMQDAATFMLPTGSPCSLPITLTFCSCTELRKLFVMMIVTSSGLNPSFSARQIWDTLRDQFIDERGMANMSEESREQAYNSALVDIRRRLTCHGRKIEDEG